MKGRKTIFDPATFKQMQTIEEDSEFDDSSAQILETPIHDLFDDPSISNKDKLLGKDADEY